MATKKTEKNTPKKDISNQPNKEPLRHKIARLSRDERTRFVAGLILLFFAIFLTISFISFFSTEPPTRVSSTTRPPER